MEALSVKHLARIEGHGNFRLELEKGMPRAIFEVTESPRFFEAILVGRKKEEAPLITSRICGICSVSHAIASLKAVEAALGVEPGRETLLLRRLLHLGEMIQSHSLHIYFLGLPDFLNADSSVSLIEDYPLEIKRALKLKKLGNLISEVVGGRSTHPISAIIGGFSHRPEGHELQWLREELLGARLGVEATVELFKELQTTPFTRDTEFVALKNEDEYPFYQGKLASSRGWEINPSRYKEKLSERVVETSTAKHSSTLAGPYTVGPLARFNLNYALLCKRAKAAAEVLQMPHPSANPFHQHFARVVELVHMVEEGIRTIDLLLIRADSSAQRRQASNSRGVGVVEAPRGLLFHEYGLDKDGVIESVNIVTPTAQNIASIEADLNAFLPHLDSLPESELISRAEALIRSYDPCLSCSTH